MKKRIGISLSEVNFKNYWSWFTENDLQDIELVELSFVKNNAEDIDTCDGFILTGGIDVDPQLYAGKTEYENKPDDFLRSRDKFEEKIYRYSQDNNKPLLAICRGLQLVNVLQGGSLIQDLDVTGNKTHRREAGADKQHDIKIESDTLLFEIAKSGIGSVNSAHHQVADPSELGDNLLVNAYADADRNIVEGLEFKDKTGKAFMLCVQWHPERMDDRQSVLSEGVKRSFLEAVRNSVPGLNENFGPIEGKVSLAS